MSDRDMETAREALRYERPCPCFKDTDILSPKQCTDGFCRIAIERIAAALAKERERCAAVADNEPEPDGSMPDALQMAAPEDIARAVVRATRKSIAAAIRAGSKP